MNHGLAISDNYSLESGGILTQQRLDKMSNGIMDTIKLSLEII